MVLHRMVVLAVAFLPLVLAIAGAVFGGIAVADGCPTQGSGGC